MYPQQQQLPVNALKYYAKNCKEKGDGTGGRFKSFAKRTKVGNNLNVLKESNYILKQTIIDIRNINYEILIFLKYNINIINK